MLDYMMALHQRFYKEPECEDLRSEIEILQQQLRRGLPKRCRHQLLRLSDLEAELQDEISLASFTAGFRLAWGIISELSLEPPFSFLQEEERRAEEQNERR